MESVNREDYLRGIYHLMEDARTNNEVKSVQLADYLSVTKASVSEMLKELDKDGMIDYRRYSKLKFTKKGHKIAKEITSKHRIIERFLTDVLKMSPKIIHDEAHRLEHAFSDESIKKLRKLLGNPKQDPHGKPIPT